MTDPISTYVDEVARHLRARGTARRQALADLEAALRETAAGLAGTDDPPAAAVASFGSARAYATELDAELRTERPLTTVFGIPNSLAAGVLERMAATFDPSDPHVVVPHVFGIGWAVNMGAVAARLGLLNPDDLDDELLEQAIDGPGRYARAMAWASVGAVALATAATIRRRRRLGFTGRRVWADVPGGAAIGAVAAVLVVLGADEELPARQRLVAPAYGVYLATIGTAAQGGLRPDGTRPRRAGAWGLALGTLLWWAATYGPVRAAVGRAVRR